MLLRFSSSFWLPMHQKIHSALRLRGLVLLPRLAVEVCGHWSLAGRRGQLVVHFGLLGFVLPETDVVVGHVGRAIWVEARETSLVRWTWIVAGLWPQLGYGEIAHSFHVGS